MYRGSPHCKKNYELCHSPLHHINCVSLWVSSILIIGAYTTVLNFFNPYTPSSLVLKLLKTFSGLQRLLMRFRELRILWLMPLFYLTPTLMLERRRCTITSIVITYVRHQITTLQYSIKGGAQGTRWRPGFKIRWLRKWQHVSTVSSSVSL